VKRFGIAIVGCVFLCVLSAQAESIYITGDAGKNLYVINSINGAGTLVGNFGFTVLADAFNPNGTLYGMISGASGVMPAASSRSTATRSKRRASAARP